MFEGFLGVWNFRIWDNFGWLELRRHFGGGIFKTIWRFVVVPENPGPTGAKCEAFYMKNILYSYANKTQFCTYPCFESEGFCNSEMAYWKNWEHAGDEVVAAFWICWTSAKHFISDRNTTDYVITRSRWECISILAGVSSGEQKDSFGFSILLTSLF